LREKQVKTPLLCGLYSRGSAEDLVYII